MRFYALAIVLTAFTMCATAAHAESYDCENEEDIKHCLLNESSWDGCFCPDDGVAGEPTYVPMSEEEIRSLLARLQGLPEMNADSEFADQDPGFTFRNIWAPSPYQHVIQGSKFPTSEIFTSVNRF